MVQTEISFRCVASVKKGFGNFNRSVILAEGLREKKYQILFLIDNEPKLIHELIKRKFQFSIIPKFRTNQNESLHIIDILEIRLKELKNQYSKITYFAITRNSKNLAPLMKLDF